MHETLNINTGLMYFSPPVFIIPLLFLVNMKQAVTLAIVVLVSLLSIAAYPAQAYECASVTPENGEACPPGYKQPEPKEGEMMIRTYLLVY